MKLVNILARDWTTWPYDHAAFVSQDADRDTAAFAIGDQCVNARGNWNGDSYISGSLIPLKELADDHLVAIVTYGEWEIARESTTDGWNGEGLPPAGTVCEVDGSSSSDGWGRCVIKYSTEWVTVFTRIGSDVELVKYPDQATFRPIRTPEQIAAEKREKAADDIHRIVLSTLGISDKSAARALYDAGYRKTDVQ